MKEWCFISLIYIANLISVFLKQNVRVTKRGTEKGNVIHTAQTLAHCFYIVISSDLGRNADTVLISGSSGA